jgi:nicotinamide-nucleotide amidase
MNTPCIALLLTGNELMSGDTVDSNSAMIATQLGEHGLEIGEKCTVGDDPILLQSALARLSDQYPAVIVNGGLGPTRDDLTSEVIAALTDVELTENPEARAHVEDWCAQRRIAPNPANLKQAFVPTGCELIHNPLGSALGFAIDINNCLVLTTPGVPSELEAMLPALVTRLKARVGGEARQILRLQTFGIGESSVEQRIKRYATRWPSAVTLGFRAGMPQLELKLSVPSIEDIPAQETARALLEEDFGDHILGENSTRLAEKLQAVLRNQNKTMTTAESCTGGLIASMMVREPGSSAVLGTGFVTYANRAKRDQLGVAPTTLKEYGAVSEPVVKEMLLGALHRSGADIGVAVSGIAGPGGGTEDKPVGTVWIAWGTQDDLRTHTTVVSGSRSLFQNLIAAACLDLIRRHLEGLPPLPHYFTRQA